MTGEKRFAAVNQAESLVCEARAFKESKQLFEITFSTPNTTMNELTPEVKF